MTRHIPGLALSGVALGLCAMHGTAEAQRVINDTLTGASSSYNWRALNGACLTAGNNTGTIPACSGLAYYNGKTLVGGTSGRLPDAVGSGALRLTNGDSVAGGNNGDNQTGAVVSNFDFPTNEGLQVTFTTVTYGGDNLNQTGADGISFYLMDGAKLPSVGGLGGSLGYSCSNVNSQYDGVAGGYIGIGIDEYGNFSNPGDNTNTGPGFAAGRISVRGAGDTNWASLNARFPTYYPAGLADKAKAVRDTCKSGVAMDFSGAAPAPTTTTLLNYGYITHRDLGGVSIANQQGVLQPKRGDAIPITYDIKITQDGLLDVAYSVNGGSSQSVISAMKITQANGALPASFRFGFSAGTGGGNNVHEITCFKAAPVNQSGSSAGTNVQQSARVEAGTQVYLAYYHPTNWWGELTAQNLVYNPSTDMVSINPVANWNASCVLTGGSCPATAGSNTAQGPDDRAMLTWDGGGIPFRWASLSDAQKAVLTAGDASSTNERVRYLRGERTREVANNGPFRTRTGVLGDIADSSPTWVGPPSAPYTAPWKDALHPSASAPEPDGSYASFKSSKAARENVVYVGANDGFLHGFRAGAYDSSGNFNSAAANDGRELIAYMPGSVLSTIHSTTGHLDYSSTQYSHNFHVDATPGTGDLYYQGAWHTWVVGALGPGGNATGPVGDKTSPATGAIFALDVTDPSRFSEADASSLVVGDWTSSTLSCSNASNCNSHLGSGYGTPAIRRLHDGSWAVLFGNGLNSASGSAGLFVMLVNPSTGNKTFRYFDTGSGPVGGIKNGIVHVTPADLDGDHITDYVYAADVFGKVWRFDLTATASGSWSADPSPLFTTPAGQPITSKLVVASVPTAGSPKPRVIVGFGTGQRLVQTLTSAPTYAAGTQSLYGIWDWNMSDWNSDTNATVKYESLAGPQSVSTSDLQAQTATTVADTSYRTVTRNKICWKGSSACTGGTSGNAQFGWKLDLPSTTEQVIYSPVTAYGMFIVNTTIPAASQALTCESRPASGYTMAVTMGEGGAASQSFFGDANNNYVTYNGAVVSGIGLSATGTPSIVTARGKPYLVQQTVGGTGSVTQVNPGAAAQGGRLNWIKVR